ncbi:MAG: hypothetical protein AAGJ46_12995 [Planctomycetota bacterium]
MPRPPLHVRIAYGFASAMRRIGDAWNRLVAPIEDAIGWVTGTLFGVFDNFNTLESFVVRVFRVILWPVTALFGALAWLIRRVVPSAGPDGGIATLPGRLFGSALNGVMKVSEKLNLDGALLFLVWLTTPVWWPVLALLSFVNAWIATRQFRELALGTPALLLAAPFAYVAIEGSSQSQNQIASSYKAEVRRALDEGDSDRVRLMELKLAQLGVDTRQADYKNALQLADDDRFDEAYAVMSRLAPNDQPGYLPAHAWIARSLLLGQVTEAMEPTATDPIKAGELAERHVDLAVELGAGGPAVDQLRGHALAMQTRFTEAAATLADLSESSREAAAARLTWLLADGRANLGEARKQAANLLPMFQAATNAELSADQCQAWFTAAGILGDNQAVEAALLAWQKADASDPRPAEQLLRLRRRRAEQLVATQTANPAAVAKRLVEAAVGDPPGEWLLRQAATLLAADVDDRRTEVIAEAIMASPEASSALLEALGTAAATRGKIPMSRRALARAVEQGGGPAALNNYAWALNQEPDPNPELALKTVNRALETLPADHRFRETRGQILISLKQWQEAAEDLEFALNRMPNSGAIHRSLAEAYQALSQPSLAEAHRRLAAP